MLFPESRLRPARGRTPSPAVAWGVGCAALFLAAVLAYGHGSALRELRTMGLPAALRLPSLEERRAQLQEQEDVASLHASLQTAAVDEWVRTSVLPSDADTYPVAALLQAFEDVGRRDGSVQRIDITAVHPVQADASIPPHAGEQAAFAPIDVQAVLSSDAMERLLQLLQMTSILTVGDALSDDERSLLLQAAEEESPVALTVTEQFFSTDILTYALDPVGVEHRFLQLFPSPLVERTLSGITAQSHLQDARHLLGGPLGQALLARHLWPSRLLVLQSWEEEHRPDGLFLIRMTLRAYVRQTAAA